MKILKIIIAILLIIGIIGSTVSLLEQIQTYEPEETIGHLIAIILISYVVYLLLKSPKDKQK